MRRLITPLRKSPILLCICIFSGYSIPLTLHDTLSITVTGGAALRFLHGAGPKATESGLLFCSLNHVVNDQVRAFCALRATRYGSRPLIEEAAVHWSQGNNAAGGGFLSNRYGFNRLYRPNSPFTFLFDKPVLWDSYGFGFSYSRRMGKHLSACMGSSVNLRENGQAHLLVELETVDLSVKVLAGFQSYSPINQDNLLASGLDMACRFDRLQIHAVAKYNEYLGYGRSSNPTMSPEKSKTGLLELSASITGRLNLHAMSYYVQTKKLYYHEFFYEGLELTWTPGRHADLGFGGECQIDGTLLTVMPRIFTRIIPAPRSAYLELSYQPSVVGREVISHRVSGELWLHF